MPYLTAIRIITSIGFLLSIFSCTPINSQSNETVSVSPSSKEFKAYWYAGEAELTRYELQQARYGEIHKGDAVLIFVTEDINTKSQVKYEYGNKTDVKPILKLNLTKKFFTGIYPYSMMSSIFTPIDYRDATLKVTTTSQEWCGHTYSQINLKNKQYKGRLHSYFQDEGDQEFALDAAMLEDEIWTKIRLDPSLLPTGDIRLIPGAMYLRLSHKDYKIEDAQASLVSSDDDKLSDKSLKTYKLEYKNLQRTLAITYETDFPYNIVAWEESGLSGFGANAKPLTTKAIRTHTLNSAYWGQHDNSDADLKKQLGLDLNNY